MNKLSMSKYCKQGNINIISISKKTRVPLKELNIIYNTRIEDFNTIVNHAGKTGREFIMKVFNITPGKLKIWLIRGLKNNIENGKRLIFYPDVCDFIASGRA